MRLEGVMKRVELGVEKLKVLMGGCGGGGYRDVWNGHLCGTNEKFFGKYLKVSRVGICLQDDQRRHKPHWQTKHHSKSLFNLTSPHSRTRSESQPQASMNITVLPLPNPAPAEAYSVTHTNRHHHSPWNYQIHPPSLHFPSLPLHLLKRTRQHIADHFS